MWKTDRESRVENGWRRCTNPVQCKVWSVFNFVENEPAVLGYHCDIGINNRGRSNREVRVNLQDHNSFVNSTCIWSCQDNVHRSDLIKSKLFKKLWECHLDDNLAVLQVSNQKARFLLLEYGLVYQIDCGLLDLVDFCRHFKRYKQIVL